MKITKTQLKQIIKEELARVLHEAVQVSDDPKDCPPGQGFGSNTGKVCKDWLAGDDPRAKEYIKKYGDPGCTPGAQFSPITGQRCKSAQQPAATPGKQQNKMKAMKAMYQKKLAGGKDPNSAIMVKLKAMISGQ